MADTQPAESTPGLMHIPVRHPPLSGETARGWMVFAGVMLLLAAAFNAVYGFAVIFNDDYLAEESLLYGARTA